MGLAALSEDCDLAGLSVEGRGPRLGTPGRKNFSELCLRRISAVPPSQVRKINEFCAVRSTSDFSAPDQGRVKNRVEMPKTYKRRCTGICT
jgi:hypothetical protein